jgi:hypothetical protein
MADAKLSSEQLAEILRRLEGLMSQAQSVRGMIIDAMADRRRAIAPAERAPLRKAARRRVPR